MRSSGTPLTVLAAIGTRRREPEQVVAYGKEASPWRGRKASRLSREQRGRFVATCWTAQMFKHFDDPKPGYVAAWPDLPAWQQETDADIFDAIEKG